MINSAYEPLDEALKLLSPYGSILKNGLTSHAPMVAESLCALGRPADVIPWIHNYIQGMEEKLEPKSDVTGKNWTFALGQTDRMADWIDFFLREFAVSDWRIVLNTWVDRLSPGFCSDATHGVIRVGHAVRSFSLSETVFRRNELAEALAGWAATYQTLPDERIGGLDQTRPYDAISRVKTIPQELRNYRGTIVAALKDLYDFPDFKSTISIVDLTGNFGSVISEMTLTFAKVFLENAKDNLTAIVFVHGLTSLVALRHLFPFLEKETIQRAMEYGWQSSCSLYAAFSHSGDFDPTDISLMDKEMIVDRAIETGDEHAIKFTEACLGEYKILPDHRYIMAAQKSIELLNPTR